MKKILTILALTLSLFGASLSSAAVATEPKTLGLMFYADTCASCKILDPKVTHVQSSFEGEPILFVKLDHSNDFTTEQASLMAGALNVTEAYETQRKASGFLLLVDASSGEILNRITRSQTEAQIKEAIRATLD